MKTSILPTGWIRTPVFIGLAVASAWLQAEEREVAPGGTGSGSDRLTRPLATVAAADRLRLPPVAAANRTPYEIKLDQPAILQEKERLWHPKDQVWQKYCLPIGNGKLGAMVYGGVEQERLNFTIDSLWSGRVYPEQNREGTWQDMERIRALLMQDRYVEAEALATETIGAAEGAGEKDAFGSFSTFGDLVFDSGIPFSAVEHYQRWLDVDRALSVVEFTYQGHQYRRMAFASHPDQCLILRFEVSAGGTQDLTLGFQSPNRGWVPKIEGDDMVIEGKTWRSELEGHARIRVKQEGGTLEAGESSLSVKGAQVIEFYLAADTNYDVTQPRRIGASASERVRKLIDEATTHRFETLLQRHVADYQALYRRVHFDLGDSTDAQRAMPMDQRIKAYRQQHDFRDPDLVEMVYQFGRYLLISSSRPGTLPANLQGIWNNSIRPAWSSDYHININLQMNYWPAGPANLLEMQEPLVDYMAQLVEPGRKTARAYYNARGWLAYHASNIWGHTAPRYTPGRGQLFYLAIPTCSIWLSHQLYEHFAFGQDEKQLKERLWPTLSGAADFAADYLYRLPDGTYTSLPSWSSEHGTISKGATSDIALTREILKVSLDCAAVLGIENERTRTWRERMQGLIDYRIGQHGQLQEWYEDRDDPNNKHRHINHLAGLHPGTQISPVNTPELAQAALITLQHRGDRATGWSLGWKLNFWARMRNSEKALMLLNNFIGGKMYPNLLGTHPPFQIDGNFGVTAGIMEILLQSQDRDEEGRYILDILPALPAAWPSGSIRGLKARGNQEVSIAWDQGRLTSLEILSHSGKAFALRLPGVPGLQVVQIPSNERKVWSF